jgi:hypothetical protein
LDAVGPLVALQLVGWQGSLRRLSMCRLAVCWRGFGPSVGCRREDGQESLPQQPHARECGRGLRRVLQLQPVGLSELQQPLTPAQNFERTWAAVDRAAVGKAGAAAGAGLVAEVRAGVGWAAAAMVAGGCVCSARQSQGD